jgi:LPS export ABC transporter protein LptC
MNNTTGHKILVQAAYFIGCLFFFSCENDQKAIDELTLPSKLNEEARTIEALFSQSGTMKSKLTAPVMLRFGGDTSYVEFPRTLHVNFFDSAGKVESQLNARYGQYFERLNKVFLRDSVIVFNVNGDTMRSPELWWDQGLQKFYTEKNVRIRKSGNIIYGTGMDAKQDLSDINIRKVTGIVLVPDSLK